MKAKEYLNGIRRKRLHCQTLWERVKELRTQAEGLRAVTYDKDRVQVSPANRMEDTLIKLESITKKYVDALEAYHTELEKARDEIDAMPNEMYREVLILRYMTDDEDGRQMSLEKIACTMHRNFDHVRHIHGNALREFERMFLE